MWNGYAKDFIIDKNYRVIIVIYLQSCIRWVVETYVRGPTVFVIFIILKMHIENVWNYCDAI